MWCRGYRDIVRQTTVRLPDDLAESLASEIDRVRADKDFTDRARKLVERDKELLDRLAR